jgi:hypothetical protein
MVIEVGKQRTVDVDDVLRKIIANCRELKKIL